MTKTASKRPAKRGPRRGWWCRTHGQHEFYGYEPDRAQCRWHEQSDMKPCNMYPLYEEAQRGKT